MNPVVIAYDAGTFTSAVGDLPAQKMWICPVDVCNINGFRADSEDIDTVAAIVSHGLFGGIPFSRCTNGRMGRWPAVKLNETILGFTVYVVHMDSRDPKNYTLELEYDGSHRPDVTVNSKRCDLMVTNGILLQDFVADRLESLPGIWIADHSRSKSQ